MEYFSSADRNSACEITVIAYYFEAKVSIIYFDKNSPDVFGKLRQFHSCKMQRAANHSFIWENIGTTRNCVAVFLKTAVFLCTHSMYTEQEETYIYLWAV